MRRENCVQKPWTLSFSLPIQQQRERARKAAALLRSMGSSAFESLEERRLFAVTASAAGGVLTVTGDANANAITVSRDVAGNLKVKSGAAAVAITGSLASVATIHAIQISGLDGNDNLKLD